MAERALTMAVIPPTHEKRIQTLERRATWAERRVTWLPVLYGYIAADIIFKVFDL